MGRNPKLRVSYDSDAQYMLRLKHAIECDSDRDIEWRKEAISKLQDLIEIFIQAPPIIRKVANQ